MSTNPELRRDPELRKVYEWFVRQSDYKERAGWVIRKAIDEVLDGVRTGRYAIDQLDRVEKTYIGYKIEYVFLEDFKLPKRLRSPDTEIAGVPVDIKWSINTNWMIPPEDVGGICLLLHADEESSRFDLGLLRARDEYLRKPNRDGKRGILARAREHNVVWLARNEPYPENILLHLSEEDRSAILAKRGNAAVVELFRRVQGKLIPNSVLDTVARQRDSSRRARGGGEGRTQLEQRYGLTILNGHWVNNREVAKRHGIDLKPGYWVSIPVERQG